MTATCQGATEGSSIHAKKGLTQLTDAGFFLVGIIRRDFLTQLSSFFTYHMYDTPVLPPIGGDMSTNENTSPTPTGFLK